MLFDVVATNREKCTEADMEGEIFDLDAFVLELLDKFFGHVKAGGWGSGRTELFSPDGLIAFDVFFVGVAVEIGRKGNIAVIGDDVGEVAIGGDGGSTIAKNFFYSNDVVRFAIVGDIFDSELITGMEFAAVHDVVDFAVMFFEHNELARTAIW